jgi:hypothetical protein
MWLLLDPTTESRRTDGRLQVQLERITLWLAIREWLLGQTRQHADSWLPNQAHATLA